MPARLQWIRSDKALSARTWDIRVLVRQGAPLDPRLQQLPWLGKQLVWSDVPGLAFATPLPRLGSLPPQLPARNATTTHVYRDCRRKYDIRVKSYANGIASQPLHGFPRSISRFWSVEQQGLSQSACYQDNFRYLTFRYLIDQPHQKFTHMNDSRTSRAFQNSALLT